MADSLRVGGEVVAERASELMNEELGATTYLEHDRQLRILGRGCPRAALTGKHPAVCRAIDSLLAEILNTPVHECCDRMVVRAAASRRVDAGYLRGSRNGG